MKIQKNFSLKDFTTIGMGGLAKFFVIVRTESELLRALGLAKKLALPWYVLGEGSNVVVSDRGFRGLIVRNYIEKYEHKKSLVRVGAGDNLLKFIFQLDVYGFEGMERMAGIPGTVGGAIYGCAGAYGQEVQDHLVSVRVFDGRRFRNLTKKQCRFGYRSSVFKKRKNWIITEAAFRFDSKPPQTLLKISRDIIKLREKKYKPGLKCPGSFFKNIKLADLTAKSAGQLQKKVEAEAVKFGKLPSGYLLDRVGAKGMREGRVAVAGHHGNLIYNLGGGRARDVKKLSTRLKALVKKQFGIIIDEEVQYL